MAAKATENKKEKSLVIVESPAKSKTIRKILGDSYQIEASFGHVRNLPEKDPSTENLGFDIKIILNLSLKLFLGNRQLLKS